MVFATISHGFSPPKLEETLLPDGLINDEIEPETGWNYEIGSRGKFIGDLFNCASIHSTRETFHFFHG